MSVSLPRPLPPPNVPLLEVDPRTGKPTGKINKAWWDYLKSNDEALRALALLS